MTNRRTIDTTVGPLAVQALGDGPTAVLWPSLFMDLALLGPGHSRLVAGPAPRGHRRRPRARRERRPRPSLQPA